MCCHYPQAGLFGKKNRGYKLAVLGRSSNAQTTSGEYICMAIVRLRQEAGGKLGVSEISYPPVPAFGGQADVGAAAFEPDSLILMLH